MKLKILTFIIIITLPLFFLSCAPKEENLLEPQGPSEIIPAEIKNNPNVIYNSQNSNSEQKEKPLADTFNIKVKDVEKIGITAKQIKNINKVNLVKYGEGIVEQLLSVLEIVDKFLIGIVVALILVTVFLVSNTIKITIFSRRKEIEIMRLVGASNINIKLPFMIEGLFLGLLGSIIPITVTIYGYSILYKSVDMKNISPFLQLVSPTPFIYIVSLVLLGIGVIVGMFGSAGSVRKYLKI